MMSRMRTTAVAVVVVMAALGIGACADEPAGPTRAEFIAKVDAQCQVSNIRTKRLNVQAAAAADTRRTEAQLLRKLVPILERGYEQVRDNAAAFRAVDPPPADTAEVEQIRKLYDEQAEIVRKLGLAAKRGDVDAFKAVSEEQKDVIVRARKATSAYGF